MLKQNNLFCSQALLQFLLSQHVQFLLDKTKRNAFTGECRFAVMWPRMWAVYTWKRLEPLAQMAVSILRAADWDVRCPQMPAGRSAAGKVSTSGGAADQGTCQACRQRVMATNCVNDGAAESTLLGAEAEGLLCSALPRHFLGPCDRA